MRELEMMANRTVEWHILELMAMNASKASNAVGYLEKMKMAVEYLTN